MRVGCPTKVSYELDADRRPPLLNTALIMNVGSFVGYGRTLDEHDARTLLHPVENNFAAIGRHIEIANNKVCRQFSQLALDAGLRIQLPEILAVDAAAQEYQGS